MQRENISRSRHSSQSGGQRDQPAFDVVPVGMDVQRPSSSGKTEQFGEEPHASANRNILVALPSSRIHVNHAAMNPHLVKLLPHLVEMHGDAAMRWRVRTNQNDLHTMAASRW